jgi:hypothetical protein
MINNQLYVNKLEKHSQKVTERYHIQEIPHPIDTTSKRCLLHSGPEFIFSHLLPVENLKHSDKNKQTMIYSCFTVLHGCQTQSHTIREEYRLRMFEHIMLRKITGTKREEGTGNWKMKSFVICTAKQIVLE